MSNRVTFKKLSDEKCKIILSNRTRDSCTTVFEITVFDSNDDRWEDHARETVTVAPNSIYEKEFHKYGATDWDYTVIDNYCE